MCLGSARTGGSQKTTNAPWGPSQEYFKEIYSGARDAFNQANDPTGDLAQSKELARNVASGIQVPGNYSQMLLDMAGGRYLDPATNPFLASTVEAATRPMTESFTRDFLPNVSSAAIKGGAYGGSRQGVVEALGASELSRNIGDTTSQIYGQNYANERQNQLAVPQLLQALTQAELLPSQILSANAQADWSPILNYANIFSSLPSFSTSTAKQRDSGLSSVLNVGNTLGGLL